MEATNVFSEAQTAVAKVMKDYLPIVSLADKLNAVQAKLAEIGELDRLREVAARTLVQIRTAQDQANAELTELKKKTRDMQAAYDSIKAALSSVKL